MKSLSGSASKLESTFVNCAPYERGYTDVKSIELRCYLPQPPSYHTSRLQPDLGNIETKTNCSVETQLRSSPRWIFWIASLKPRWCIGETRRYHASTVTYGCPINENDGFRQSFVGGQ